MRISNSEIMRQHPHEHEHQGHEQPDRAGERDEVPPRRVVHLPRRRQEVAMQARDDDDEPFEPHADVDEHRHREQHGHVAGAAVSTTGSAAR